MTLSSSLFFMSPGFESLANCTGNLYVFQTTDENFSGFRPSVSSYRLHLPQNHRMAELGRDLCRSSCPATSRRLHRTISRWLLSISKDGDSTTSLGNLCQCRSPSQWKSVSSFVQREPPIFQFVPVVSGPVTGHQWKEPVSVFFTPSLQVFEHIDETFPEPSLL